MTNQEVILKGILDTLRRSVYTGQVCIGEEVVSFDDSPVVTLTPKDGAQSAILVFEADATTSDKTKIARFYESGTAPTSSNGHPVGDLDIYEIKSRANLLNFKVIGIESGKTHKIQVLYYNA